RELRGQCRKRGWRRIRPGRAPGIHSRIRKPARTHREPGASFGSGERTPRTTHLGPVTDHEHHSAQGSPSGEAGPESLAAFREFRERMNSEILEEGNLVVNRFFNLDGRAYEKGALDVRTKELMGLVASLVLRCDDCITYHVIRCR